VLDLQTDMKMEMLNREQLGAKCIVEDGCGSTELAQNGYSNEWSARRVARVATEPAREVQRELE
jgi:hypothetical protein